MTESFTTSLVGRKLAGKFELVALLGQGGMGAVYEAKNDIGKKYAVKVLLESELSNDPLAAERFFREARASASIESEHIAQVFDTGIDMASHSPFIIMELLRGEDLEHAILRVGPLMPVTAVRVITQAAAGLGAAHAAGIVHRDIKPANLFIANRDNGRDAVVKILDFGIAKETVDRLSALGDVVLTKTGTMLGTPMYMSPEQAEGKKTIDARTDVWSLGMCLYEALSGTTPWTDVDTLGGLIVSICSRDVRPLQEVAPWVPGDLALAVHRALARDAAHRTPTVAAFAEELRPFLGGSTTIHPGMLVGIDSQSRTSVAPRVSITPQGSVGLATEIAQTNRTIAAPLESFTMTPARRSNTGRNAVIAVAVIAIVGGGAFALTRLASKDEKQKPDTATSSTASASTLVAPIASTTATTPPPLPSPELKKTGSVTVKAPAGATVKVGKEVAKLENGAVKLSGFVGQQFIVSVYQGTSVLIVQPVYMDEAGPIPEVIDTAKGVQVVQKPIPKTKPSGTPTSVPSATATPSAKPKPSVETTFE